MQQAQLPPVRLSSANILVRYNNGAQVKLRRPTNEELDDFFLARNEIAAKEKDFKSCFAGQQALRIRFFDALFIESINLVDEKNKPIVKETVGKIPGYWKTPVINKEFERLELSVKNC